MPYGAHVIAFVENALAEIYSYHDELDAFLRRSGISDADLQAARAIAEEKTQKTSNGFRRAPKRYVVQEVLLKLNESNKDRDQVIANLITALCKGSFPEATPKAVTAINSLTAQRLSDRQEAEKQREEWRRAEREKERVHERAAAERAATRDRFKEQFITLAQQHDPQTRGYMLERFLNEFLVYEGVNPRGSFKLAGEQIDGSFAWANRTYLVEAKWVNVPVGGAGFSGLMYKIEGKTADTRGLFVAVNGYSKEAIQGLKQKGELRFVCIDGAHIMRCLEPSGSFSRLLEMIWRHASETGEAYLPVGSAAFIARDI